MPTSTALRMLNDWRLEADRAGERPAAGEAISPRVDVGAVLLATTERDVVAEDRLDRVRHAVALQIEQRQVEVQPRPEMLRCQV